MDTKKLLVWLKVCFCYLFFALTSCQVVVNPPEPPDTPDPPDTVVTPKPVMFIEGYINLQEAVRITAYCLLNNGSTTGIAIASSEIENGNFKLLLPDPLDNEFVYNSFGESDEEVEVSCPDARGAIINYIEIYRSGSPNRIGQVFYGKYFEIRDTPTEYYSHGVNKFWYYLDKDVTVKGTRNNQGRVIDIFDLSLKKGWNEVYWETIFERNKQTGVYTWTTTYTTTKSERYEGLEWYIWTGQYL